MMSEPARREYVITREQIEKLDRGEPVKILVPGSAEWLWLMPDMRWVVDDKPTEAELNEAARAIGRTIDSVLPSSKKIGFTLFLFEMRKGGWLSYISNADRRGMIDTIRGWLRRQGPR